MQVRRSRCSCIIQEDANIKKFLETADANFLIKHCSNTPMRKDPEGRCTSCAAKGMHGDAAGELVRHGCWMLLHSMLCEVYDKLCCLGSADRCMAHCHAV
jgi:hypothetical protein